MLVRMGARLRSFATLISLFALIGQMLLPVAHAASMERQTGDPLSSVFCGAVSEQSLGQFRDSAPPELLAWLKKADHEQAPPQPGCDLCASFHANYLAGAQVVSLFLLRATDVLEQLPPVVGVDPIALVVLPPLRAPPALI